MSSLPVCEVCKKPLLMGKQPLWPWTRQDPRFPSGVVQKITWIHEACKPKDDPQEAA